MSDRMPTVGLYRGVPLFDFHPLDRIDETVKPAIDAIHAMNDVEELYEYALDYLNPPEARLLAKAKIQAIFETRAGAHESRGDVDMDRLNAATTGLDSLTWTDPEYYVAVGTPGWRAPGVRNTMERRPPHQVQRLLAAREAARAKTSRQPVMAEN
jgi:hypothetical protein